MTRVHEWGKAFTPRDQDLFARLSGDHNPMHVDSIAARRLMFGGCVVHALNTVTWSLDCLAELIPSFASLIQIRASFPAAVLVGDAAVLTWSVEDDLAEATVTVRGEPVAYIEVQFGAETTGESALHREIPVRPCEEVPRDQMATEAGSVDLEFSSTLADQMLPNLSGRLPPIQLAALLATTRIVGMRCPGLHSVYGRLNLKFDEGSDARKLDYRVTRWDPRSGLTTLGLGAPGIEGSVGCLYRPTPADQPSIDEARAVVQPQQFAEQSALVVGGSRGLGELTAKLIAAGGGDVMVTYASGRRDAERLADEVRSSNVRGAVSVCRLDVLEMEADVPALEQPYTHIYYFATPRIRGGRSKEFDEALFCEYLSYYVEGASRVLDAALPLATEDACVIWPSTIFVEERPERFREYVAAKVAGETWCSEVEIEHPGVRVVRPRLPRLKTDQTGSLQPEQTEDNLSVMLALCARAGARARA
jgi:acyl dehydratase/NAD(P)-dependent dehydrogenase (short-subunit alcohol dehydrogenase family)